MSKQRVYVTGLPRSGSTLLCQLLAQHPSISCDGMTSPLFNMLERTRVGLSADDSFLSRLDSAFNQNYARLAAVYKGMISGWLDSHADEHKSIVVDKSRGWLKAVEFLREIDPDFKMIVCIRELGQLFGSVESAHRKTALLGFRDGMSHHSSDERASQLFGTGGVIGDPIKAIRDFRADVGDQIKARVYYVAYEALVSQPIETMRRVHEFIGADPNDVNPEELQMFERESDSHYGMKWPHETFSSIKELKRHVISEEVQRTLLDRYAWYYEEFYPSFLL